MDKIRVIVGSTLIIASVLAYSVGVYDKPIGIPTTILGMAILLGVFTGSFIVSIGLLVKTNPAPKPLEQCKCGKPGVHGFLKGNGKTRESYAECEKCFTKNVKKMTIKYMKEAISKRKLDICPLCGLKGKRPSSKVKHYLRFYKCPNGHNWEISHSDKNAKCSTSEDVQLKPNIKNET